MSTGLAHLPNPKRPYMARRQPHRTPRASPYSWQWRSTDLPGLKAPVSSHQTRANPALRSPRILPGLPGVLPSLLPGVLPGLLLATSRPPPWPPPDLPWPPPPDLPRPPPWSPPGLPDLPPRTPPGLLQTSSGRPRPPGFSGILPGASGTLSPGSAEVAKPL